MKANMTGEELGGNYFAITLPFAVEKDARIFVDKKNGDLLFEKVPGQILDSEQAFALAQKTANMVAHPPHYNSGKIEVIEFIEDQGLAFSRGNAVKYIARAGKKDPTKEIEDLEKAVWYVNREIELLKAKRKGARSNDRTTW